MSREPGYYWVKYRGEWTIGQYRLDSDKTFDGDPIYAWTVPAYVDDSWWHSDGSFEEIDERRITRDVPYYVYQECPDPRCFFTGECQQSFVKNGKCLITPSSPSPSPE